MIIGSREGKSRFGISQHSAVGGEWSGEKKEEKMGEEEEKKEEEKRVLCKRRYRS